jgi:ABC-type nickel/cobalt efflux system permease component RcnA
MSDHNIEHGDVEALAAILESERVAHCRKRGLCFGLFLFSLVMLVFAVVIFGVVFVIATNNNVSMDQWLPTLQLLPPLSAAVVGFFGSWWASQNCINSIERTLFAARAGRVKLFASFLQNLQCTDKKKRQVWMDMAASLVG